FVDWRESIVLVAQPFRAASDDRLPIPDYRLLFESSSFAIASRWTSSGPSASRIVREWAHADASGKSSDTPAAPCAWMARSNTHSVIHDTTTLIIAISARATLLPTVSIIWAAFIVNNRACSISIRESA